MKCDGIHCWDDFLSKDYIPGISFSRKDMYNQQILKAKRNLDRKNAPFFFENIPKNEQWRLYDIFKNKCAYLDIETTGLSQSRNKITTVSIYDGRNTKTFIRGENLRSTILKDYLRRFKMVVTFNGSMFDIPFIKSHFPRVNFTVPHMDLRWVGKRVGLVGGLKSIEKQIGIIRGDDVKDVDGLEAVRLWKKWEIKGDKQALDTLVKYNQEDVINLKALAEHVYGKLLDKQED